MAEQPPLQYDTTKDLMALALLAYVPEIFKFAFTGPGRLDEALGGALPSSNHKAEKQINKHVKELKSAVEVEEDPHPLAAFPWLMWIVELVFSVLYKYLGYRILFFSWAPSKFNESLVHILRRYPDLRVVQFCPRPMTYVVVSDAERKAFVTFRGTTRIIDWLMGCSTFMAPLDAAFSTTEEETVYVHAGFQKDLLERKRQVGDNLLPIYDELRDVLRPLLKKQYEVHVTGHSLGGAMATLYSFLVTQDASLNLSAPKKQGPETVSLSVEGGFIAQESPVTAVVFGAPRVGNAGFKEAFETSRGVNFYRVGQRGDLLTAVPTFDVYYRKPYCHVTKSPPISIYTGGLFHGLIKWSSKGYAKEKPVWAAEAAGSKDSAWLRNCYEYNWLLTNSVLAHSYGKYYDVLEHAEKAWNKKIAKSKRT